MKETLVAPDPKDELSTILELDELWSFALKRVNQVWIWIALCEIRHDKWLGEPSETKVKKPVKSHGTIFQMSIVKDTVLRTFGENIRQSFQKNN